MICTVHATCSRSPASRLSCWGSQPLTSVHLSMSRSLRFYDSWQSRWKIRRSTLEASWDAFMRADECGHRPRFLAGRPVAFLCTLKFESWLHSMGIADTRQIVDQSKTTWSCALSIISRRGCVCSQYLDLYEVGKRRLKWVKVASVQATKQLTSQHQNCKRQR